MNTTHSIHSLRARGFKVRVSHERYVYPIFGNDAARLHRVTKVGKKQMSYGTILEKGGKTTLDVTDANGVTHTAIAECSKKDAFNRKLGNKICLARLAKRGVV